MFFILFCESNSSSVEINPPKLDSDAVDIASLSSPVYKDGLKRKIEVKAE